MRMVYGTFCTKLQNVSAAWGFYKTIRAELLFQLYENGSEGHLDFYGSKETFESVSR